MDKIETMRKVLAQIGVPEKHRGDICVFTLLALGNIRPDTPWRKATNSWNRIHDILTFTSRHYNVQYAENSRETFRKQAIHPFRTAAIIEDNGMATNSPKYSYRLTAEFLEVVREITYSASDVINDNLSLLKFISSHESLSKKYASRKRKQKMPVRINQLDFSFSPGRHNQLQKAVLEEFAPRFAPSSECLYVGDTICKSMVNNTEKLSSLGLEITVHDKMPDIVLFSREKNWIYFIECVTSVGPMDSKRILEIESLTQNVKAGKIYVTAFPDFATYKKFSQHLAWDTEVWISELPDHMIHLNGDKFLGPRNKTD